ncbi:MAG: MFS transporter [Kiritimatiellales bacterium]
MIKNYPPEIRKALRIITLTQCTGQLTNILFGNGFMLAYFMRQGVPDYRILFLFAMMPLIAMLLTVPFSLIADYAGKRFVGAAGIIISSAGIFLLFFTPFFPSAAESGLAAGTVIFSLGATATGSSWFALLSPIVPAEIRGRWFGFMRMTFQFTGVIFSLAVAALLRRFTSLSFFQTVLFFCGGMMIFRIFLYRQIPELEPCTRLKFNFPAALRDVVRIPGYMSFCAYMFLLAFCTGAVPNLLGLLQREFLGFTDSMLVVLGNLLIAGTIAGFFVGGKLVDRIGPRPVFLTAHIVFSATIALILFRGFFPLPTAGTIGLAAFFFGAMQGATGIAGTSELLALIPPENKSFTTGMNITLSSAGLALSGVLSGQLLQNHMLHTHWQFYGQPMSAYDTILAVLMFLVALMAVTLGLVPAVRHLRAQWLPQNR